MKRLIQSCTVIVLMISFFCMNGAVEIHAAEDCEGDACIVVRDDALQQPSPWSSLQTNTGTKEASKVKPQQVTEIISEQPPVPEVQQTSQTASIIPRKSTENDYVLFLQQAEESIRNTENETVIIETKTWISFNRKVMQAVEETGREVVVRYRFQQKLYETTVPAGTRATEMLTEDGYCGFLYLQTVFGSELIRQ